MAEERKEGLSLWVKIVVALVVVAAIFGVWKLTSKKDSSVDTKATETAKSEVVIPDGWKGFTSNKYHFSLSYPSDYTLTESAVGNISLTKGDKEVIDLYVLAANGDEAGMMTSTEALYTDDAKGYMIMDSVVQGKVANFTSKTINGKFGKNASKTQGAHDGETGSAVIFTTDDKLFTFSSYDNGDETLKKNFEDFLKTIGW